MSAVDTLESALALSSRDQALRMLCRQPALLTDTAVPALQDKLEALSNLFKVRLRWKGEVEGRGMGQDSTGE